MKKIITILTITAVAIASVVAASTNIQLQTDVPQVGASFELLYGKNIIETDEYIIDMEKELTQYGLTDVFLLRVTSNYDQNQNISVNITPGEFMLQRDGINIKGSEITPSIMWYNKPISSIPAGVKTDLLVTNFKLEWHGSSKKSTLDAGTYVSDVTIEYSTN